MRIISNGSKWAGDLPDSIDELYDALRNHTLSDWSGSTNDVSKDILKGKT